MPFWIVQKEDLLWSSKENIKNEFPVLFDYEIFYIRYMHVFIIKTADKKWKKGNFMQQIYLFAMNWTGICKSN